MVLDHLVLGDAHARLGRRQLRQRYARLVGRNGGRLEDRVHLFLRIGRELRLRRADAGDLRLQFSDAAVCGVWSLVFVHISFLCLFPKIPYEGKTGA